jgi:hypothetical protein
VAGVGSSITSPGSNMIAKRAQAPSESPCAVAPAMLEKNETIPGARGAA